jgi:hypothetical protein
MDDEEEPEADETLCVDGDLHIPPSPSNGSGDSDAGEFDDSFSDTGSSLDEAEPAAAPQAGLTGALNGAFRHDPSAAALRVDPLEALADPSRPPQAGQLRDPAWRSYRRTLEWRCRWTELRMSALSAQEARYARLERRLAERQAAQPAEPPRAPPLARPPSDEPGSEQPQAAPSSAAPHGPWRRRRRRRAPASLAAVFPAALEGPLGSAPPARSRPREEEGALESDSDLCTDELFDSAVALQARLGSLFGELANARQAAGLAPAPPRRAVALRLGAASLAGKAGAAAAAGPAQRRATRKRSATTLLLPPGRRRRRVLAYGPQDSPHPLIGI